jgi:arylamine N-acetyltransferase
MSDDAQAPDSQQQPTRFEATVHVEQERPGPEAVARISALDLDRIPDPDGVRLLISLEDAARLVDQGFEVRLLHAVPVRPLDPDLIASDDETRGWFDDQVRGSTETEAGVGPDVDEDDRPNDEGGER